MTEKNTDRIVPPTQVADELRRFLTEWPLYTPFAVQTPLPAPSAFFQLPERLSRPCPTCRGEQTTTWTGLRVLGGRVAQEVAAGPGKLFGYRCNYCRKERITIWLQHKLLLPNAEEDHAAVGVTCRKFGQWPSVDIDPPREVERAIESGDLELYRKGVVSFSHGYGIAALAYFRRVIENTLHVLLDGLAADLEVTGNQEAADEVRRAREAKTADEKLRVAADALPASITPGGVNPLSVMYADFSEGIHGRSEAECLETAAELRRAFEFTFTSLRPRLDELRQFQQEIKKRASSRGGPTAS